jgi:hypothetical protein
MVPPIPPSQAGKFKPRKPAKKIRVLGVVVEPVAPVSGVVTAGQRGRTGGRGGGRGGGGRASGRGPQPQGQVFFTGTAAPTTVRRGTAGGGRATNSRGGAAGRDSTTAVTNSIGSTRAAVHASNGIEEIVGILQDSIGSGLPPETVVSDTDPTRDRRTLGTTSTAAGSPATVGRGGGSATRGGIHTVPFGEALAAEYMYDSDSSDEKPVATQASTIQPLLLPFPNAPGGTTQQQPVSYAEDGVDNTALAFRGISPSPFLNWNKEDPKNNTSNNAPSLDDSWFFVQMPTRLPPLKQQQQHQVLLRNDDSPLTPKTDQHDCVSDVVTPSVDINAFDNALINCTPGRLGKIKVYASGRTVLVVEGEDGQPSVSWGLLERLFGCRM